MSANFVGNTLTQSEAIETYTPYDVTSCRPRKTRDRKIILRARPGLKFENYESVQHGLQFFGIKKRLPRSQSLFPSLEAGKGPGNEVEKGGSEISFHRYFKNVKINKEMYGIRSLCRTGLTFLCKF